MTDQTAVTFLQGNEIVTWLRGQTGVQTFRYRPNTIAMWLLFGFMVSCFWGAIAQWYEFGLDHTSEQLAVLIPTVLGVLFGWQLAHVAIFTVRAYVALTDNAFLFGRGSRAWVVPRGLINRETVRWERMRRGPFWMTLPFSVHGWRATGPLVNPFFLLRDIQNFVAGFLQFLIPPEALADTDTEDDPNTPGVAPDDVGNTESAEPPVPRATDAGSP